MAGNRFEVVYGPLVENHLDFIDQKYHRLILGVIEEQLTHEPSVETRNRKPLSRPMGFDAKWELRFGPANRFRVFYSIDDDEKTVQVHAIGVKIRNKLFIEDEEYTS